jgi:DNA-binding transcriptional regulator YdaS (Cro superfamily)
MLAFQASVKSIFMNEEIIFEFPGKRRITKKIPKPIAPYNSKVGRAALNCFDRENGASIHSDQLKTYRDALAQYHLSPETKFLNGDYLDRGPTRRRHVEVIDINHIGKEANRWEEQYFLGFDPNEQIEYGFFPNDALIMSLRQAVKKFSQRMVANKIGISRSRLAALLVLEIPSIPRKLISAINRAISELNAEAQIREIRKVELLGRAKLEIERIGLSEFAVAVGVDPSNVLKLIKGRRTVSPKFVDRISDYFSDRGSGSRNVRSTGRMPATW